MSSLVRLRAFDAVDPCLHGDVRGTFVEERPRLFLQRSMCKYLSMFHRDSLRWMLATEPHAFDAHGFVLTNLGAFFDQYPYTHRVPNLDGSCVSCITPSMTATICFDTRTINRPDGSSFSLRWVLHPLPMRMVAVHAHPNVMRYFVIVLRLTPCRALDRRLLRRVMRSSCASS